VVTNVFGKSRTSRLSEARRRLPDLRQPILRRVRSAIGTPSLIALGFFVVTTWVLIGGEDRFNRTVGFANDRPIFSRVSFERVNELRTAELKKNAQQLVPSYYRLNTALIERVEAEFLDLHAAVKAAENFASFEASAKKRWELDEATFRQLKDRTDEPGSAQFKRDVESVSARLKRENMIEKPEPEREIRSTAAEIQVDRGDGKFEAVGKERLTYAVNAEHIKTLARTAVGQSFPPDARADLRQIIERQIEAPGATKPRHQPVYVFDREMTRQRIAAAANAPDTIAMDAYAPGDLLVKPGVLDNEEEALLKSEHDAYLAQRASDPELHRQWRSRQLGLAGIALLITLGLAVYSIRYQPKVVKNPARTLAFGLLLLAALVATQIFSVSGSPYWSVAPVTVVAAILTIAYAQRFAIGATALLSVLLCTSIGGSIGLFLVHMTVICVAALLLSEIRTRLKMVEVGVLTALAGGVAAGIVGLTRGLHFELLMTDALRALIGALAGVSVILVLLPLIEKTFRIATSLTLLEWADTSTPLLKQLIQKAPGTWQHSHLLGSMAESAAEEIGANGLQVRVGAYYHDIGKMLKPQYFVENQRANMNAHDGLAPTMSLLVILAHVKDGLALAKEYGLPPVLHQFIAEHHGTTVVKYFHSMAAQRAELEDEDREVSETEFRYGGPKPRSRESAILMLCDGVEGAVRSLQDPTPGRIEAVVHEIVMARLLDGQLDDCDFTLKELSRVEQSLVKSLCAIHHGRIAYPKAPEKDKSERKSTVQTIRSA